MIRFGSETCLSNCVVKVMHPQLSLSKLRPGQALRVTIDQPSYILFSKGCETICITNLDSAPSDGISVVKDVGVYMLEYAEDDEGPPAKTTQATHSIANTNTAERDDPRATRKLSVVLQTPVADAPSKTSLIGPPTSAQEMNSPAHV